ncbi:uncharacterized protein LOC135152261 [Daucus carota subsp. sativus]|uniref:uncharacterized protein LOC135152261 n=1 Tax=Daucus carota subsp. sativus TaxID=79200 RepID=UPI003082A13A
MGLDEYMKRFEILPVHEDLVEGAGEVHEGEVNEYEMRRIRNIEENEKIFEELGLKRRTRNSVQLLNEDKPNNMLSDEDGSEYMCPENDQEQQSDHEEDIVASKAKKKAKRVVVQTDGPRTRSRASKMPKPCDKEVKRVGVQTDHQGNDESNNVPTVEKLKLLKSSAPGSMEKYLELREQEKQAAIMQSQSQPENQESQPESDAPTEVEKRKRGKSKLGHVHTRGEKKEIKLSDLGQPISDDDDHLLSEFSNFLGTTVREFVSLTCRSWSEVPEKDILWQYVKDKYIIPEEGYKWVMTTMRDQFRAYKARIKREHYSKYGTDEERLENRPRDVPLKDFKMLLIYWADEKIKDKAIKNIRARSFVSETHTVGPRSFTQVCHKMEIAREQAAKPDEPAPRTVEDANKLVYGDKKHSRSYLLGRLIQRREAKGKSVTHTEATISDQVLASLTEKIREQLAQEMEEKMDQKVRENVKAMVSKLAEKNPDLKIDIQDLSVEPTYDASASGANTATTDTT